MIPDALSLAGKRIAITGAAGGIGLAMARCCAEMGGQPLLLDVTEPDDVFGEFVACDVTNRDDLAAVAAAHPDVDDLITGAGICPFGDWEKDPDWDEEFRQVIEVNLLGTLNAVRAWLPAMRNRGQGRVVLIGSLGGRNGGASPIVQPHYVASKGGVHALVWYLAKRNAPYGILVNGIAPGPVGTAMTATTDYATDGFPLGRVATPEEIAWPALFLCSDAASYFSGAVLDVNGGLYVS